MIKGIKQNCRRNIRMIEKDFFDRFNRALKNTKNRYNLDTIHDALILWFGENYLSLDPSEIADRIVKDNHAEGVDAILIDQVNYELFFIQAKAVDNFNSTTKNFPENDIKLTLEGVRFLLRGDYKGEITPELENLVDEYHELDKTGDYNTSIIFITLKREPIDKKFIDNFKKDFSKVDIKFYDFEWFYDYYVNTYLTKNALPPERISFKVVSDLLKKDTPQMSRVFTCKGEELARIYNDYKERIFQQNVRYSLGLRSKSINRQILETAEDNARSLNFWYFNNGITIVCKKIIEATSGKVISLENVQIINGAQTTYALHEAYIKGDLKENVEVLIKAIQTDDQNFIENVTLYTNSQNAIRLRDLCSNDPIQLKIHKIILESYQYFMERKRGEFDSLYPTVDAKRKFLGKDWNLRVFSNENASQAFLAMFLDKPAQAKTEKGRIFLKDNVGFYYDIFDEKDPLLAEKFLMSWKLLQYIEEQKKNYKNKYKSVENCTEEEKNEIYKYDFLLHSEYFILNIFKDFLKEKTGKNLSSKDDLVNLITEIDANSDVIKEIYETIKNELAEYINKIKTHPGYYHNKFFKNEKSIGLIRSFFKQKYSFVNDL